MQIRTHNLIVHTLNYINECDNTHLGQQAALIAIEDLLNYSSELSNNRERFYQAIDLLQSCIQLHKLSGVNHAIEILKNIIYDEPLTLKIDFLILRQTHWGAIKPIADILISNGYDVRIIPLPMIQETQDNMGLSLKNLIGNKYQIIDYDNYRIEEELPDIVFDDMAVDSAKMPEFRFLRIKSMVDATVHIEHSILTGYNEAMKRSYLRIGRTCAWIYLVPSPLFKTALPLVMRLDGKIIDVGCPEMDTIFHLKSAQKSTKRTILWNIDAQDPEHELPGDKERLEKELCFLKQSAILYPNIDMIVRTHPNFENQDKCKILNQKLKCLIEKYPNIKKDYNKVIYDTYCEVDAMVTWMSSTTMLTFAATGKPLILLPTFIQNGYDTILDMYLLHQFPIGYTQKHIQDFIENIDNNQHKNKRLKVLENYVGPLDGTACFKIVDRVINEYEKTFNRYNIR